MEQTKNEPTKRTKLLPKRKPKRARTADRGATAETAEDDRVARYGAGVHRGDVADIRPSSGKEQQPGTDGYNTEMPDADKANKQIIGDKLKAYEHGEMEERLESRNRAIGQLGDMFDREIAGTEDGRTSTSPIRAARRKRHSLPHRRLSNPPLPPTVT